MRCKFLFLLVAAMHFSCTSSVDKKEESPKETIGIDKIERSQINVYALKSSPKIDTLLLSLDQFSEFKRTMEDLSKLNPLGIEPFLLEALLNCEKLLRTNFPYPFDVPDIKSRLKVVKTCLLKARYFSQEKNEQELNTNLKDLYQAYAAFLKRIEDYATEEILPQDKVQENTGKFKKLKLE